MDYAHNFIYINVLMMEKCTADTGVHVGGLMMKVDDKQVLLL